MTLKSSLTKQLEIDEGRRACAYQDHLGYWTIGIGRLVDSRKPGAGLRNSEIEFMLSNDIDERIAALARHLPWIETLDEARQGVLINMSFQMGVEGLMGFKNTLRMVAGQDYAAAADGMLHSLWARQTPERAQRLAEQMRTGVWQFEGA